MNISIITAETAVTAETLVIAKTSKRSDSKNEQKLRVCSGQRDLAQTRSMRRTVRTSTKSANTVDYENLVYAVDCENLVYAVDCENLVYAVDSKNSHKLGVCSGQGDFAQIWSMRRTARTSTKAANAVDCEN